MNSFHLPLAILVFTQVTPPTELAPAPAGVPLQPAPAAVVPSPPELPPALQPASPAAGVMEGGTLQSVAPAVHQPPVPTDASIPAVPTMQAPTAAAQTSAPAPADVALPEQLWRAAMESTDPAAFQAERKSLLDTLRSTTDTAAQALAVKAYWQLSTVIVQFSFAEEEAAVLGQAAEPRAAHERAFLAAARAAALARQQELQLAVVSSQYDLAERSFGLATDRLPWPTDMPLMGRYRTNFDVLFSGRVAPAPLARIHRILPTALDVLEGRAAAVAAGGDAVRQVAEAYAGGQAPLKELLETVSEWREQRAAFANAVRRYNEQIADYALTVVGPVADPATIISTLINWKPTPPSAPPPENSGVRQASAVEPPAMEVAPSTALEAVIPSSPVEPTAPSEPNLLPQTKSVLKQIRIGH